MAIESCGFQISLSQYVVSDDFVRAWFQVVDTPAVTRFLDGITAGVIGLIAMTAVDLTRAAVVTNTGAVINPDQLATAVARPALSAIVFTFSLIFLYLCTNRYSALFLVAAAALAGQKLYR